MITGDSPNCRKPVCFTIYYFQIFMTMHFKFLWVYFYVNVVDFEHAFKWTIEEPTTNRAWILFPYSCFFLFKNDSFELNSNSFVSKRCCSCSLNLKLIQKRFHQVVGLTSNGIININILKQRIYIRRLLFEILIKCFPNEILARTIFFQSFDIYLPHGWAPLRSIVGRENKERK